jgi:pre-peptidase
MRRQMTVTVALVGGLVLLPTMARAQLQALAQRCDSDSLPADLAEERLNWMRRCALVMHVGNPSQAADTGMMGIDGNPMYDYTEPSDFFGMNAYVGSAEGFQVNQTYLTMLYMSGVSDQLPDPDLYLKWTNAPGRKRPRPRYPVYGNQYDVVVSTQLYPHPTLAGCNLYTDRYATTQATTFYVNGFCDALPITPLANNTPVSGLADTMNGRKYYSLTLPAGVSSLTFETSGGTGDVDLYVKSGSSPTFSSFNCRPYVGGNYEVCTFSSPAPGTWYVMLHGWSSYSALTLTARY